MDKKERENYRKLLLREKLRIFQNLGFLEEVNLEASEKGHAGIPTHPAELGTDNFEKNLGIKLATEERSLLEKINKALEKVDDQTYGLCENCGKKISKKRLKAIPYTKLCYNCQKEQEK